MFKIKDSKVGGNIPAKLCEGKFRVRVELCKGKKSENKSFGTAGDPLAIVEFTPREIYNQSAIDEPKQTKDGEPVGKERVVYKAVSIGQRLGWKLNMKEDAACGNLVEFCAAAIGVENPRDVAQVEAAIPRALEYCEAMGVKGATNDDEIGAWGYLFEGFCSHPDVIPELLVETRFKRTNKGFSIMVHDWAPLPGASEAEKKEDGAAA